MENFVHNQTLILYADASAPQHTCLAGLGGVVTCAANSLPLVTMSRRIELNRSCTLHAELMAICTGLSLLPRGSNVLLRSDSISALWLLHVTDIIPYQNIHELERMAGGKKNRLEQRKKRQAALFLNVLQDCQTEADAKQLRLQSLWIKGHSNNDAHALADRLAARAIIERSIS